MLTLIFVILPISLQDWNPNKALWGVLWCSNNAMYDSCRSARGFLWSNSLHFIQISLLMQNGTSTVESAGPSAWGAPGWKGWVWALTRCTLVELYQDLRSYSGFMLMFWSAEFGSEILGGPCISKPKCVGGWAPHILSYHPTTIWPWNWKWSFHPGN